MSKHKFIITKDQSTAMALKASGVQEISSVNGIYVFMNQLPTNFNFANFDKTKIAYTNILSI